MLLMVFEIHEVDFFFKNLFFYKIQVIRANFVDIQSVIDICAEILPSDSLC